MLSSVIVLIPGLPLFPLMWLSQVANAMLLPLVLVLMLQLANSGDIMKQWGNGRFSNIVIVVLIVLVSLATLVLFVGLG